MAKQLFIFLNGTSIRSLHRSSHHELSSLFRWVWGHKRKGRQDLVVEQEREVRLSSWAGKGGQTEKAISLCLHSYHPGDRRDLAPQTSGRRLSVKWLMIACRPHPPDTPPLCHLLSGTHQKHTARWALTLAATTFANMNDTQQIMMLLITTCRHKACQMWSKRNLMTTAQTDPESREGSEIGSAELSTSWIKHRQ